MAERPLYSEIEHTADVGVELTAPDLKSAFERIAASMFDMMCDLDGVGEKWRRDVRVEGRDGDLENLLVRWLSELLFLFATEHVLLSRFEITHLGEGVIEATVVGERIDWTRHAVKVELKAPTYHDLRIEEEGAGWCVRVIFDT
jgi:SHS2 domain-containing protein